MRQENAADHARAREFLNPAQQKAIEEVLSSHDRIHGLQGLAGSGKTTTLEAIREGAERNGYAVEGFAPTGRAAGQLRDAGIHADTLQGFWPVEAWSVARETRMLGTFICSTNPASPAPARCNRF